MNIEIRNHIDNTKLSKTRKIECRIIGDTSLFDTDSFAWGFEIINSPAGATLYHSQTTPENVFLNYQTETPLMELSLSEFGTYQIKIVLQHIEFETKMVTNFNLDAEGNLIEELVEIEDPVQKLIKSNIIELVYDDTEESWN